ncbi:MAG: phosphatidate cytidylyltransferase [Chitinophagaceae bacterium]|nr:MAG: phosphatidate cytidylyltransferase [Chitinophagaceae bacterium]
MALNRGTLKTRSLTAVVFVVVMLAGLLVSNWTFFLLFSIIHFGCWFEYQKLISLIDKDYKSISDFHRYGVMVAGWCFMLYFTNNDFRFGDFYLHPVGWWLALLFAFLLPIIELLFSRNISPKNIGYSAAGILYISLSCGLMVDLLLFPSLPFQSTPLMPILIIACMWINDTMAYIVGSLVGKTPLTSISPKKTWEGTIGGIVLCVTVVTIAFSYIPVFRDFHFVHWLAISLIASVTGTFGDILESWIKRKAGVKDSGTIMPGHGGFLDRFDSLLIATPFVWAYVQLFLR